MSPDFSKYETACMLPDLQKKKKKIFFIFLEKQQETGTFMSKKYWLRYVRISSITSHRT